MNNAVARMSLWKTKQLKKATKICIKSKFENFPNLKTQKIILKVIFNYQPIGIALNKCFASPSDLNYTIHWILELFSDDPRFFSIFNSCQHFVPLSVAFFSSSIIYSVTAWQKLAKMDSAKVYPFIEILKNNLCEYFENNVPLPQKFIIEPKLF